MEIVIPEIDLWPAFKLVCVLVVVFIVGAFAFGYSL